MSSRNLFDNLAVFVADFNDTKALAAQVLFTFKADDSNVFGAVDDLLVTIQRKNQIVMHSSTP